jgi:transposase
MRAYLTDLKERLVPAVADGQPMREPARRFGVAVTTVKRAVIQQRETGSLEHCAWWAEHQGQELGVRVLQFPSRLGVLTNGSL